MISKADKQEIVNQVNRQFAFKSNMDLVIQEDKTRGILKWGKRNEYPEYLLSLYKGQPQHAGIIKAKAKYLSGTGIKGNTPQADEWLKKANPKESWQDLRLKYNEDKPLYGGIAIKIIPNAMGVPLWYFHLDYGKLRPTICGERVQYSEDWTKRTYDFEVEEYPIWYPGCKTISVRIWKNYNPTTRRHESAFPGLEYESGIKSIDTLKRIQNFKNSLVINNFSTGAVITIFEGQPATKDEKDYIVNRIKGEHTGDEEAGNIVVNFTDAAGKAAEVTQAGVNDLDKQYQEVVKTETNNVYAAHNAPPDLFNYISDTSKVFDVNKVVEQNELFMNSYVIPGQEPELKMLADLYKIRTGLEVEFIIEQFRPIGLDLPLDQQAVVEALNTRDPNIIPNYLIDKYKLQIPKALPAAGAPGVPVPIAQVNEHLKNLNGRQMQGIDRIVRKYKAGSYSDVQARMLLKSGFGLTDQECAEFLGSPQVIQQRVAMARQFDFLALVDKYAHDTRPDEVLEVTFIGAVKFAEQLSDDETRNSVLEKLKADPEANNQQLAEALGISVEAVGAAVAWLLAKKLLSKSGDIFKPRNDKKATIYTEYNYDKRPDVPGPAIIATTRDFCRNLYSKFKQGARALTFEAIDSMTNDFGMDVWSFRGGWYTDPKTDEPEPFCRHVWKGTTKVKYE